MCTLVCLEIVVQQEGGGNGANVWNYPQYPTLSHTYPTKNTNIVEKSGSPLCARTVHVPLFSQAGGSCYNEAMRDHMGLPSPPSHNKP
ncbi:hypothetical protein ARMA_0365 [Ardenticatena maritima]|uniref:Uncharacterized protein n=1 Tax=Ardenticatena maritima TaxID=872965 RepID=A0A0M9UBM9_9CHLR|nr:hypothetical protein ARMA_0365 [Ardenticatena maritima]